MKKIISIVLVVILTLTCCVGCGNPSKKDPDAKEKIVVAYGINLAGAITSSIAVEKGYFAEEGLEVELLGFNAMPAAIAAMVSGDIDFCYIGQGAHALAMNGQATILTLEFLGDGEKVIARKDSGISTLADLKGKTVAVQFGTSAETVLNLAMEKAKLTRKDVEVVNMDLSGCATAILSGQVDAVCTYGAPSSTIISQLADNAVVLSRTSDYSDNFVSLSSWCTLPKTIKNKPELVQKFTNAIAKSMDFRAADLDQSVLYAAKLLKQDLSLVLQEKDDAKWFSSKDVIKAINSKEINSWYDSVMKEFVKNGKVSKEVAFDEYFDTTFIIEADKQIHK